MKTILPFLLSFEDDNHMLNNF